MTNPSDTQVPSINPLPLPPQEQSSNASQATVSLIFVITVFPSWGSFYSLSPLFARLMASRSSGSSDDSWIYEANYSDNRPGKTVMFLERKVS